MTTTCSPRCATCRRSASTCTCPVQSGSNDVLQRMKRGYTVEEYREMLARIREMDPGRRRDQRLHRRLLRRDRRRFPADDGPGPRVAGSRTASSSNTASGPAPRAPSCIADDVPDEVKRRRNNELLALQNEISEEDNHAFLGQQVEVLVEGPSKAAEKHAARPTPTSPTAHSRPSCSSPAARIATGSSSSTATAARSARSCRSSIYDANAHTLFGEVVTRHVGPGVVHALGSS